MASPGNRFISRPPTTSRRSQGSRSMRAPCGSPPTAVSFAITSRAFRPCRFSRGSSAWSGSTTARASTCTLGGSFQLTPNTLACQVAKFDGVAWQQVGIPFSDSEVEAPTVKSLIVHDLGQGPRLVAAGYFQRAGSRLLDNMAVWDGSSWRAIGDSTYFRSATYHDDGTGRDVYGATWSIRNSYWPRPDRVVRRHDGGTADPGRRLPHGFGA